MPETAPADTATGFDRSTVDLVGFEKALTKLGRELQAELSPADLQHLKRSERWGRFCTVLGYLTAWLAPNPLSMFALAQGLSVRWMMMHHIGHGGYDRVPGTPDRYTTRGFARGWRRWIDWLDWIDPEAWKREHNELHHVHTGQEADPDLLERNLQFIRNSNWSRSKRMGVMALLSLTWKLFYYAPTTLFELRAHREGVTNGVTGKAEHRMPRLTDFFNLFQPQVRELWTRCLLPYGVMQFVIKPGLFLALWPWLGAWAWFSVLVNTIFAELITNLHTFLVVAPNHSADDLYRFDAEPEDRAEFYLHQVIGTTNYRTGGDVNDVAHLWLNYQIEHHLWPNLPMAAYQRAQPRVEAICKEYGVPYIQESVWTRARKMLELCLGVTSMKRYEPTTEETTAADEAVAEASPVAEPQPIG